MHECADQDALGLGLLRGSGNALEQGPLDERRVNLNSPFRAVRGVVRLFCQVDQGPCIGESADPATAGSHIHGENSHAAWVVVMTFEVKADDVMMDKSSCNGGRAWPRWGVKESNRTRVRIAVIFVLSCALVELAAEPAPKEAGTPKVESPVDGPGKKGSPAPPALLGRQGLYVGLGFFSGTHRPEMQDRFANDRFFAALLFNGFAVNSEWEETGASGLPLYVAYHAARWQFSLENSPVSSTPHYDGFLTATITSVSPSIGVSAFDRTTFDALNRTNTTLSAGYLVNPGSSVPVHLLFGLRSFSMMGDYSVLRLTHVTQGAAAASGFETTLSARLEADASGPLLGAEMLVALADRLRLKVRARLWSGTGTWRNGYTLAKTSGSGITGEFSSEEGKYSVVGTELEVGVSYEITSNGSVFARFSSERLSTTDSEVVLIKVSSVASENNNRGTEFALTYPGSTQEDRLSGLTFGYEHRFNL